MACFCTSAASDATTQRYFVWDKNWVPNGPVLLYTGGQGAVDKYYDRTGLPFEIAPLVQGLVVFAEHRCAAVACADSAVGWRKVDVLGVEERKTPRPR